MNRGVVLDTYYRDALLATCFQEGLLYDDEEKSDRVFKELKEHTVDRTVKSILLENVMLSGRFILDTPFGEWLSGPIIDDGILSFVQRQDPASAGDNHLFFSIQLLLPFLKARRTITTLEALAANLNEAHKYGEELTARFGQIPRITNRDGVPLDDTLADFMKRPRKYSKEDYEKIKKWKEMNDDLRPIISAIDELKAVEEAAARLDANRLLHIDNSSLSTKTDRQDAYCNLGSEVGITERALTELRLFRVTCQELGRLPIRSSLKETIELAHRTETNALREQIQNWTGAIEELNENEIRRITAEIKKTTKWHQNATDVSTAFDILTVIGLPLAIGSLVFPDLAGAGLALTGMGALATTAVHGAKRKLRWVMFGQ